MYLLTALAIFPLLLLQIWSYRQDYENWRVDETQNELEVARGVASSFSGYIHGIFQQNFAIGTAILANRSFDQSQVTLLLTQANDHFPVLRNLSWVNPQGIVLASSLPDIVGRDLSARSYFKPIAAGQNTSVGALTETGLVTNQPTLALATAMRDGQGNLQGVVVASIEPSRIGELSLAQQRPEGGFYSIFDRTGTLVYDSTSEALPWVMRTRWKEFDPLLQAALDKGQESSGITWLMNSSEEWVAALVPIPENGFFAGARRPVSIAIHPLIISSVQDTALTILVGFFALLLASLVSRTISDPIYTLELDASAMKDGVVQHRDDPGDPSEILRLRSTVERMAAALMKRADELRESEERYKVVFENRHTPMAVIDAETYAIVDINPAALAFYGWTRAEMLQKRILDINIFPPEQVIQDLKAAQSSPGGKKHAFQHRLANGDVRDVDVHSGPIEIHGQTYLFEIIHDVSERKQLESEREQLMEQLDAERARWQGVVEGIPDEVWICDAQGRISFINLPNSTEGLDRFEGLPVQEVVKDWEVFHLSGEIRPADQAPLLRAVQGETVHGEELVRSRRNGEFRRRQFSAAPTRESSGKITGAVEIVRDVTDVREMADRLRQNETQLQAIFESMSDAVVVYDQHNQVVRSNSAAQSFLLDDSSLELVEKSLETGNEESAESTAKCFNERLVARVMNGEQITGERVRVSTPGDLQKTFLISASPLRYDGQGVQGAVVAWHDISELEQAQTSLAIHKKRLEDTLESIQDGFMELNKDWCFTYINRRAAQISRLEVQALIGKNIWERYPSLVGTRIEAFYGEVMEGRQPNWIEMKSVQSDTWYEIRAYPSSEGITVFWTDITRRKRLEEEQRKLSVAVEQSPNTILITDPHGVIEYANPHFYELTGYLPEEVVGQTPSFLETGTTKPEEYAALWETIKSGKVWRGIFCNKKRSGEIYWESASIAPVFDEWGKITHFLAVKEDITERRQAEAALRRSEARLRRLVETSVIGIVTLDGDGKIQDANAAFLSLMGFAAADLAGNHISIHAIIPEEYQPKKQQILQELADKGISSPTELEFIRKDGARVPVLVGHTRLDDDPLELIAFVIDLTDLKRTQAALAEYAEKLKQSNQELEQFAFVASHDLQEPLRKIQFFGESIRQKSKDALDADAQDFLGRMQNAAGRMQSMINDLLDLSRVSTRGEAFQEVDLNQVAQEVISDLEGRIRKEHGQVLLQPLPALEADRSQMQRLLQNLIGNALKYHRQDVPPVVKISGEMISSKRGYPATIEIRVEDNGIGFDEQDAERIFKPFQRLHGRSQYEGTGMGLTICQKIVERHGGKITAHSRPGEGATFVVQIPLRHSG